MREVERYLGVVVRVGSSSRHAVIAYEGDGDKHPYALVTQNQHNGAQGTIKLKDFKAALRDGVLHID